VSGQIAAVNATTMQVQSTTKQTAVTWNATTRFTRTGTGTLADVTVGSCVLVRPGQDGAASGATAAGEPVAAGSIQVFASTNGSCLQGVAGGFGGPAGAPGGAPGGPGDGGPTGAPGQPGDAAGGSGQPPTGAPGQNGGRGFGVIGAVTAVQGGSFTVASVSFAPGDPTATGASAATTPVTVTTTAATTVTTTKSAAASDVKVGGCATAQGQTDQTGAMTATTVLLRDPVGGSCTTGGGFGRPGATATNG